MNFYYVGGTSMATPHVSGVVALMLEKNPTLAQSEVESILKNTTLKIMEG
ncbi:MAG: S8 family serine peptidase [Candidatus Methanomethylicaceae archaeon]